MSKSTSSSQAPHVALHIETSLASGRDILRGISSYIRHHQSWSFFHIPGNTTDDPPRWLKGWHGAGIIARISSPATAEFLKNTGLPVVDVLGMVSQTGFSLVHVDNAAIARLAFEHFVERGIRHFAFVGFAKESWQDREWSEERRTAFCREAKAFDSDPHVFELTRSVYQDSPWEKRQDRLAKWLGKLPKPVGILVCSDQRGTDVLEACWRANIRVPEDVAVVGVDNDEALCEVCHPPLSSVSPNHFEVGYQAARVMDSLIRGESISADIQPIKPCNVVTRQSSDILSVRDPVVAKALALIRDHACSRISVAEIARSVGTSRSAIQRKFQMSLRQTIHDHLVSTRIKKAVELITKTDLPLKDIAGRSGFGHAEYMSAVFRERLGQAPSQYRQEARVH